LHGIGPHHRAKAAEQLHATKGDTVELFYDKGVERLRVLGMVFAGGPEDSQIFVQLEVAQRLAGMSGQASLVQVNFPGTPSEIQNFRAAVASNLPGIEVRPVTQFTEGEAKIYNRISGILSATVHNLRCRRSTPYMAVTYNLWLVALSYLIAVVASFTALDLGSRVSLTSGRAARAWLVGGALAMGLGIWSMHFVGMLALGTVAFVVPGVLVFVYLSLAGPVVELEKRGVLDGFRRSFRLVCSALGRAALRDDSASAESCAPIVPLSRAA